MTEFKPYRRSQVAELRPCQPGEALTGISISSADRKAGSPKAGDMIARNPANHEDQWLVSAEYFAANFESEGEHKGLPVAGYRSQPDAAVDAVNENKQTEERILRLIDELAAGQLAGESFIADQRWLAIARTDLEKGFMALNRAIFKPDRINLVNVTTD